MFEDKTILITGGTGSLGNILTKRLLMEEYPPHKIIIFSRDEAKQHMMRLNFQNLSVATDEVIYSNFLKKVVFMIGDIRQHHSVLEAIRDVDIIFHTAALKQVPTAEYFPHEAILTNTISANNIISAIIESGESVETVVATSTDKACHPVSAYGMTKAMMERLFISANIRCKNTKFLLTRYGNVMGTTGSVLPLFRNQIENKKPITVTSQKMTRYMMSLNQAVDTIFYAYSNAKSGDIVVPKIPSARMIDVAEVMAQGTESEVKITGVRPGEKLHELLVSEEEMPFTSFDDNYFIISSMLPELHHNIDNKIDIKEYTSSYDLLDKPSIHKLLKSQGFI